MEPAAYEAGDICDNKQTQPIEPSETKWENPFIDVREGDWLYNNVEFAVQNKLLLAAIMLRFAMHKGYDVSVGENTNLLSYNDFDDISEYAIPAMQYAAGSGLINGKSESTLNPKDGATRAEAAAILQRFIEANKLKRTSNMNCMCSDPMFFCFEDINLWRLF